MITASWGFPLFLRSQQPLNAADSLGQFKSTPITNASLGLGLPSTAVTLTLIAYIGRRSARQQADYRDRPGAVWHGSQQMVRRAINYRLRGQYLPLAGDAKARADCHTIIMAAYGLPVAGLRAGLIQPERASFATCSFARRLAVL
jgi:hypothetical protein